MKSFDFPVVLCLSLDNGQVSPLAWSDNEISKKTARRATKRFQTESDVVGYTILHWSRLYDTISDMKSELPMF